jgi:flagella basal body P-ring formation protein FlgA
MRALLLVLLLAAPAARAADALGEPPANIERTVREFIRQQWPEGGAAQIELQLGAARFPRCDRALVAALAPGARLGGQTSVGVRCPGSAPWTQYVPVRVQLWAEVLVAEHPLARGVALGEHDLARRRLDLATLPGGTLSDPAQALGKRLRYPVAAGTVLNQAVLEQPPLVKRGQTVTVVSGQIGLEVRAHGEALADGANGDTIRVRNRLTRRVLEGRIEAAGLVRVPL